MAANFRLRQQLKVKSEKLKVKLFIPEPKLCTDNAVSIGVAGFYNYSPLPWQEVKVDPELEIV